LYKIHSGAGYPHCHVFQTVEIEFRSVIEITNKYVCLFLLHLVKFSDIADDSTDIQSCPAFDFFSFIEV